MKIRFAVVDDAAFLRELIKNIVTSAGGVCVGEAENGDEAIELNQTTLPDLIFLDMVMPQKNGIETARALKQATPDVKIIGCSTVDDESLIENALEVGVDAYLTKPFTKNQILETISKLIPQRGDKAHGST